MTGSGKTELYLRLAREVAAAGRGVIVLVPEIALTPAVAGSFRALFGDRVAIQHSGLSDGERHDQWHRIRRAEIDVVVGTRSAVFAPVQRLGLIIVDEEHDGSYKQEESPRYNGRDVAVMRARASGALAVLGSATPSLESFYNAQNGRYELITLEKRVLDRPMAAVTIVDMRQEYADAGPDVIVSRPLAAAIEERLGRREQAMVLLNRRGFATSVFCRQCGQTLDCPNCSVTLTVHKAAQAGAVPLLQLRGADPVGVRALLRAVPRAHRIRHRAGGARDRRAVPGRSRRPRRSRHDPAPRRDRVPCCGGFRPARSTSSSARR